MYAALHLVYYTCIPILWLTNHTLSLELFSSRSAVVLINLH